MFSGKKGFISRLVGHRWFEVRVAIMTRSREWMMKKHWILFTRKLGSVLTRSKKKWNSASIRLGATLNASIKIQGTYNFGKGVELRATDGGIIQLGKRVSIGRNAVLIAQGGRL